jgi:hypothetical protein
MKWLFILGGTIGLGIIIYIVQLIIKIKTGGVAALLKKLVR